MCRFSPLGTSGLLIMTLLLLAAPVSRATVVYVDDDAPAGGDGASWATAFRDLPTAVASGEVEIRVAGGRYRVTPDADPAKFLDVPSPTVIKGGYVGLTAPLGDHRDTTLNPTIISGDLLGDDGSGAGHEVDNSNELLVIEATVTLDGLTLEGAQQHAVRNRGHLTLIDCLVKNNGSLTLPGGGVYCITAAQPTTTLQHCTFLSNRGSIGAAVRSSGITLSAAECVFERNRVQFDGGAIYDGTDKSTFVNCRFYANSALRLGSALHSTNSFWGSQLLNCVFVGHKSPTISLWSDNNTVVNCTFVSNTSPIAYPALKDATNCIVWDNPWASAGVYDPTGFRHSCVQNIAGGFGNIKVDPLFLRPPYDGGDGWGVGTDDYGDLRLAHHSPCVDRGNSDADSDPWTDGIQPLPSPEAGGVPRYADSPANPNVGFGTPPYIDMGAYEDSDCNNNGIIDSNEPDGDGDGVIDACDNCPSVANTTQADADGDNIGDACDTVEVISWESVQTHSGVELGIRLDPSATSIWNVDPRAATTFLVRVTLSGNVVLNTPPAGGFRFDYCTPGRTGIFSCGKASYKMVSMLSPNVLLLMVPRYWPYGCYVMDLSDMTVPGVAGDDNCSMRTLMGDTTGDGKVDVGDLLAIKSRIGQPIALFPFCDIDMNGKIELGDALQTKKYVNERAVCP